MAKQDLYNLFIVFAKRGFGNGIFHFVPPKSGSLSELYGKKLLVDFFYEFLEEVFVRLPTFPLYTYRNNYLEFERNV